MKQPSSSMHTVLSILIIGIVLVLGWFSQRFTLALDVTANNRHSLAAATELMLRSLNKPVELIAVLGPDPQQRNGVEKLVTRFQAIKPDISLRFVNPETDPAQARALDTAPGGELILRTGEREQRLQTLSERSLVDSLQQLSRDGERDIVFITGHAERSPTRTGNDDWSVMSERLANIGLVAREQSLVSEPYLSDELSLVVIAAPRKPYFPGELASIDSYVKRGGNLLWLSEGHSHSGTAPDLSLLSNTLGVDFLPGTVIDTASQALSADSPDFVLLDRFPAHPVTIKLSSPVLLPQATALAVTPLAGQTVEPLLQTAESSWTETGPLEGAIQFDENTSEVAGPLLLGVSIERTLAQGTQRFAVIGDADFASSQFLGNGANQSFMEALALWLTGDADELNFVTQRAPDSELSLSNKAVIVISAVYLAALPLLLFIIAGIVRWRRRRASF